MKLIKLEFLSITKKKLNTQPFIRTISLVCTHQAFLPINTRKINKSIALKGNHILFFEPKHIIFVYYTEHIQNNTMLLILLRRKQA